MTLQKDQPKQPTTRLQRIVWTVTISVAGAALLAAIVLAIVFRVNIFG
jgi:hypothetical protein